MEIDQFAMKMKHYFSIQVMKDEAFVINSVFNEGELILLWNFVLSDYFRCLHKVLVRKTPLKLKIYHTPIKIAHKAVQNNKTKTT